MKYLALICGRFFLRFCEFPPQICESCGTYRRHYETFSALLSMSGPLTNSVQIDALAMLSFLKLERNWPKNAVLNLALSCGAIWRHREKPQHRRTTTVHPAYKGSKKVLENLLPVGLLLRTNLFFPSRFCTTYTKFDNCCLRYIATCGKCFI